MRDIFKEIIEDEGFRLMPYCDKCSKDYPCGCEQPGNLTIGAGRNLQSRGITSTEAMYLLENDVLICLNELQASLHFFDKLGQTRQNVLINMCFNLGITRFLKFKKMIAALEIEDYKKATVELLDSRAARQLPGRYGRLAKKMLEGA